MGALCLEAQGASGDAVICTLLWADQGMARPGADGPPQAQAARGFLEAGVLLARGRQAGEAEGGQF